MEAPLSLLLAAGEEEESGGEETAPLAGAAAAAVRPRGKGRAVALGLAAGAGALLLTAAAVLRPGQARQEAALLGPWAALAQRLGARPLMLGRLQSQRLQLKTQEFDDGELQREQRACERRADQASKELLGGATPDEVAEALEPCSDRGSKECEKAIAALDEGVRRKNMVQVLLDCGGAEEHSERCKDSSRRLDEEIEQRQRTCVDDGGKMCDVHVVGSDEVEKKPDCAPKECLGVLGHLERQLSQQAGKTLEIRCEAELHPWRGEGLPGNWSRQERRSPGRSEHN